MAPVPDVEVKVNIPPRRRSATLTVQLDEAHEASVVVNVKSVRLNVKSGTHRYPSNAAITLPRDLGALNALRQLLEAVGAEIIEQGQWAQRDAEERAGVTE